VIFNERQKVKKRKVLIKRLYQIERISLSFIIIFIGLMLLYSVYSIVIFGNMFCIKNVKVEGDLKHFGKNEIVAATNLKQGDNIFLVSVKKIHDELVSNPWIKTVAVRRSLPDTICIYIKEHNPEALVVDNGFFYVDDKATIFKMLEVGEHDSLPMLTGVHVDSNRSFSSEDKHKVEQMLKIIRLFRSSKLGSKFNIAEIHYDKVYGYSFLTQYQNMQIFIGQTAFAAKFKFVDDMLNDILRRGMQITYMMLPEADRVIVKYRAT